MELKEQVVSLESAKRLKELGLKQESLFYWRKDEFGNETIINGPLIDSDPYRKRFAAGKNYKYFSAFTVAELINELPLGYICGKGNLEYTKEFWCDHVDNYPFESDTMELKSAWGFNLAEACANKLIYLLEPRPTQNQQ